MNAKGTRTRTSKYLLVLGWVLFAVGQTFVYIYVIECTMEGREWARGSRREEGAAVVKTERKGGELIAKPVKRKQERGGEEAKKIGALAGGWSNT